MRGFVCALIACAFIFYQAQALQKVQTGRDGRIIKRIPHISSIPAQLTPKEPRLEIVNGVFNWSVMASLPIDFTAISAFSKNLVFVAGELGNILKTSDGGKTWGPARTDPGAIYWYGIKVFNVSCVLASGFNASDPSAGIMSWSRNGAWTWGPIIETGTEWLQEISFYENNGIIMSLTGGSLHSTDGGASFVHTTIDNGWHEGRFVNARDGFVRVAGSQYCSSSDGGSSYDCGKSVDDVFDGGVHFLDDQMHGIVGGGSIQPKVEGWVHVTSDGGKTWSNRTEFPYPIRQVAFLNEYLVIATGGNFYSSVGGIWISKDGGNHWNLELDAGVELQGFEVYAEGTTRIIWAAGGSSSPFVGKIYKAIISLT